MPDDEIKNQLAAIQADITWIKEALEVVLQTVRRPAAEGDGE